MTNTAESNRHFQGDEFEDKEKAPQAEQSNADGSFDEKTEEQTNIAQTLQEIAVLNREIYSARKAAADREAKIRTLREDFGGPPAGEISMAADLETEQIKELEGRKRTLARDLQDWVRRNGRESLPAGLSIETGDDGLEVKGASFDDLGDERDKRSSREDVEWRKQWLNKLSQEAMTNFETALRNDWATSGAVNLDLTIRLVKSRIPKLVQKKAEGFLSGKLDEPPFATVWVRWKVYPRFGQLLGRPVQISNLEIVFDEHAEEFAGKHELK